MNTQDALNSKFTSFNDLFEQDTAPVITWKRTLASVVAQFITIGSGYYAGVQVGAALSVAAMMLTGSSFIAFILAFLAIAISVFYAFINAAQLAKYIVSGEIDTDYQRAKSWVKGIFKRKPEVTEPVESQLNDDYVSVKTSVKRTATKVRSAKDEAISKLRAGMRQSA